MRTLLVLVVVVVSALIVTNPGMADFEDFVRRHAADRIEQKLGGSGTLSELLGGAGGELLASNVSRVTERDSYLVCSLYTMDLDRDGRSNGRALGVAGQFVVLEEFSGEDEGGS